MRKIYIYMIKNTVFWAILGLKRGFKFLDQIFWTKIGMSHILRKNYNCFNTENVW